MHPLAHHAGEEALTPLLLLLASGGLSLAAAYGQAWLAGTRKRLARTRGRGAS